MPSPFAGVVSHAERFQRTYIAELERDGHVLDLSGPHKHVVCPAAKPRLKSPAQILQELARAQDRALKLGTLRYVEPNPWARS